MIFVVDSSDEERLNECVEELAALLGKGRAKKGMFEGKVEEGEIEFGQSSILIDEVLSVKEVFEKLLKEFQTVHVPKM
jgi:enoyl-[acyl-carrier protein] reductase II